MIELQVTKEEAEFLADVLDFWNGEMDAATRETIDTAPCDTAEELLILVSGMEDQKKMTTDLRLKLTEALGYVR